MAWPWRGRMLLTLLQDVIAFKNDGGPLLEMAGKKAALAQRCFKYIVCRVERQKRREIKCRR
jgi:hypothetical protein